MKQERDWVWTPRAKEIGAWLEAAVGLTVTLGAMWLLAAFAYAWK